MPGLHTPVAQYSYSVLIVHASATHTATHVHYKASSSVCEGWERWIGMQGCLQFYCIAYLYREVYTGLGVQEQALRKAPQQLSVFLVQVNTSFVVLSQQGLIVLGLPPWAHIWGIVSRRELHVRTDIRDKACDSTRYTTFQSRWRLRFNVDDHCISSGADGNLCEQIRDALNMQHVSHTILCLVSRQP